MNLPPLTEANGTPVIGPKPQHWMPGGFGIKAEPLKMYSVRRGLKHWCGLIVFAGHIEDRGDLSRAHGLAVFGAN